MPIRIKVKPKGANDTSENSKSVGTAKVLSGKIFVLSVFVAPYSDPWKTAEIEKMKQKVFEAERWLKAQAKRYGKNVEFVNSAFGSDGSFLDDELLLKKRDYYYPGQVVLKIGFKNQDAFVEWVKTHTGCPQCIVIVFSNIGARSYASPVNKKNNKSNPKKFNLECCLVYGKYTNGRETRPATIAHEILHLFGAWDLYELDASDQNRAIKTSEMFANSVMLNSHRDIWETQIDEINAWLVGLKEEGKDWYRWFEPRQDSYEAE